MKRLSILFILLFAITAYAQQVDQCPGFMSSRLVVGAQGRVTPGDPNNVRDNPSGDAARIGQIPGGGIFTVLDGPICADGFAWWQVDYDGLVGWTVEGSGDTYWLDPLEQDTASHIAENAITADNLVNLRWRELDFTELTDFAFSPDSRWGAFYENDGIWTIDYSVPDSLATLVIREAEVEFYSQRIIEFSETNLLIYLNDDHLVFAQPDTGETQFTINVDHWIGDFVIQDNILVISEYENIQIWDINTQSLLHTIPFGNAWRSEIALNPDATLVAASVNANDADVYVWNITTGELVHRLSLNAFGNPDEIVYKLAFSPDQRYLAGASGQKVVLWDIVTGDRVATLYGRNQVVYSPDGKLLFTVHPDEGPLDELDRRNDILVYDAHTGNQLAILRLHQTSTYATSNLTFRPDGTALFMQRNANRGDERTPLEWTVTDTLSADVELSSQPETVCGGFSPSRLSVDSLARVIPNVDYVNLRVQPSKNSSSIAQLAGGDTFSVISGPECELGAAWWKVQAGNTPGWIAEGIANTYFLEPIPSQPETPQFTGDTTQLIGASEIDDVCLSRDGHKLAVMDVSGVWLYDLTDLSAAPQLLYMPDQWLRSCDWSHDNTLLALTTDNALQANDYELWLWDTTTQTLIRQAQEIWPIQAVAFSPDDELLAVANAEKLYLWHVTEAYEYRVLQEGRRAGTELIFNPDGRHLLENLFDGAGQIWDIATGQVSEQMSIVVGSTTDSVGDPKFVNPVMSSDGLTIASRDGYHVILWNGITGKKQQELPIITADDVSAIGLTTMAFSPDDNWLITGGDRVRLWDMTFNSPTILQHELITPEWTSDVQFSLDVQYILGSNTTQTYIWDMNTLENALVLAGGNGLFDYDNRIVTFSSEGVHIWALDGTLIIELHASQ